MERDVDVQLNRELASLQATITGFAKDVQRRFDAQAEALEDIRTQTHETNGRVTKLEQDNAVREALDEAAAVQAVQVSSARPAVPVVAPAVITLSDIKWWLVIAVSCFSAGAGFAKLVGWL